MLKRRLVGLLCGCCLLLAPTAAALAAGLELGPVLLFPGLGLSANSVNNLGLTSDNPDSGWVTTISPSLRVVLPLRRFYINVDGGLEFQSYFGVDEKDRADWYLGAATGADFPGGLSFKIADKHTQKYLIGTQEYGPGEDYSLNTLTATVA